MNQPPYLKEKDRIAIVAPASHITEDALMPAVRCMENWGLQVQLGEHVLAEYFQFAGTDLQRVADLQAAISNPEIKAIICARGGYGCGRIIEAVDFTPLLTNPKWLVGFSDITVLHARLSRLQIPSIHGIMAKNFPEDGTENLSTASLRKALFGELKSHTVSPHSWNKKGSVKAMLVGGNLSLIGHLNGTPDALDTTGRILLIEDVGEYLYNIDRLMIQLKRSGALASLAGMIVGTFTKMKDNDVPFGKIAEEIILSYVSDLNIPVAFNFPAGHSEPNVALYLGRQIVFTVSDEKTVVEFC